MNSGAEDDQYVKESRIRHIINENEICLLTVLVRRSYWTLSL